MIAYRLNILGKGGNTSYIPKDLTDFLDTLIEWDGQNRTEKAYSYGNVTLKIENGSTSADYCCFIKLSFGGTTYSVQATTDKPYFHIICIKTATSVGFIISTGAAGENAVADYSNSETLKFVLTKHLNIGNGNEEKGVIVAKGTGTAEEHSIHLAAVSNTTTAAKILKTYTNAKTTILQPVASAGYTGYCPHVFIPVYQTCASSNSKATVNGANFYIMGGSLYLLDD